MKWEKKAEVKAENIINFKEITALSNTEIDKMPLIATGHVDGKIVIWHLEKDILLPIY